MIIVEITVPSLDKKYDFQLDEHTSLSQLQMEICEVLCKKTGSPTADTKLTEGFLLASMEQKRVLDPKKTLAENGIIEGSHLIML